MPFQNLLHCQKFLLHQKHPFFSFQQCSFHIKKMGFSFGTKLGRGQRETVQQRCSHFHSRPLNTNMAQLCHKSKSHQTTFSRSPTLFMKRHGNILGTEAADNAVRGLTTEPKLKMTSAMTKWKKKKKKSKVQQQRELKNLHQNLINLLTRRAIQRVQNPALLDAHSDVLATHTFHNFPLNQDLMSELSSVKLSEEMQKHLTQQTFNSHILKNHSSEFLQAGEQMTTWAEQSGIVDPLQINAQQIDNLSFDYTNSGEEFLSSSVQSMAGFILPPNTVGDLKKPGEIDLSAGFNSNIQRFKAELEKSLELVRPKTATVLDTGHEKQSLKDSHTTRESAMKKETALLSHNHNILEKNSGLELNHIQKIQDLSGLDSTLNTEMDVPSDIRHFDSYTNSFPVLDDQSRLHCHKLEAFELELGPGSFPKDVNFQLFDKNCEKHDVKEMEETDLSSQYKFLESNEVVNDSEAFNIDATVWPLELSESHLQVSSSKPVLSIPNSVERTQSSQIDNIVWKKQSKHHTTHKSLEKKDTTLLSHDLDLSKENSDAVSSVAHPLFDTTLKLEEKKSTADDHFRNLMNKAFVEASCFTGNEKIALRNLTFQANKHKITSVYVYNRLIRKFAKKKDFTMVRHVISAINQQGLKPNHQTYAGCLESIGRMRTPDCEHLVMGILSEMEQSGLDPADIPNYCFFEEDEWPCIRAAIGLVRPQFSPNPAILDGVYDNELLTGLNEWQGTRIECNQYAVKIHKKTWMGQLRRQLQREKNQEIIVQSICNPDPNSVQDERTKKLKNHIMGRWRASLNDSFNKKLASYEKRFQAGLNMPLYPYLTLFPPKDYIDIIFRCLKGLFSMSGHYSPTQSGLSFDLGNAVNSKFNIEHRVASGLDKKVSYLYKKYMLEFLDKNKVCDNHRLMFLRTMHKNPETINLDFTPKRWPSFVVRGVGKFLLDMILYDLKIDANLFSEGSRRLVPAFSTIYRPDISMTRFQEVKLHPVVSNLFEGNFSEPFSFLPSAVPMLVPPMPWVAQQMGSLLLGSCDLIRFSNYRNFVNVFKDVDEKQYSGVLDSLNSLSACPWIINQPILELQIDIFNNEGDSNLKVPQRATSLPPLPAVTEKMNKKERAEMYRMRVKAQQERQDMHGLWCNELYRLSIANKYKNETFWFPHSIDFRGRAYPLPPHFNHLGNDNVRGLLLMAKGKPLGKHGHDWLKIHLTNLTGMKKRSSNQERLEFANLMMDEVFDSADNPMTGRKWWQESAEPWQTLACCKELAKIARFRGKVEDYVCHFPVHQDGSCNGLQHYAALGRDQAGAESVNLHPFDSPRDVYSDVVELVEEQRKEDADSGLEMAQSLEGAITRKVVKPTVMTTVYGVTTFGARQQMYKGLLGNGQEERIAFTGALYLTKTTFKSLQTMFTATKDIQDWLTNSARHISAFAPVEWVTPLGFPVLQPYFKPDKGLKGKATFKINTLKQKNGFAANYIHSLDSTHMMLTSLYCQQAGITYVSVHDCFWTHPCDVEIMNKVTREQFVNMHKQPLLETLSAQLVGNLKRTMEDGQIGEAKTKILQHNFEKITECLQQVPERGTFDLDNVIKSVYFFS